MPKKEFYCVNCDESFTVTHQKGFEVTYCPQCGEQLGDCDTNILDDED